jgi:hypothetical protein
MPTDQAPWEVIRAAADRLAETAESVGEARTLWAASHHTPWSHTVWDVHGVRIVDTSSSGVADWIAALSPAVAEPLVAWLRDAAEAAEEHASDKTAPVNMGDRLCSNELKALDLAIVIMGGGHD